MLARAFQFQTGAKGLRGLVGGVFAVWLLLTECFGPAYVGVGVELRDGRSLFWGGVGAGSLCGAALFLAVYLSVLLTPLEPPGPPCPGVLRRLLAYCVDIAYALVIFTPVVGLAADTRHWRQTGTFQWSFTQTTVTGGDGAFAVSAVTVMLLAMAFYWMLPLRWSRASPGSCLLGYRIVSADGAMTWRRCLRRFALGLMWPMMFFKPGSRGCGRTWIDRLSGTYAARL